MESLFFLSISIFLSVLFFFTSSSLVVRIFVQEAYQSAVYLLSGACSLLPRHPSLIQLHLTAIHFSPRLLKPISLQWDP